MKIKKKWSIFMAVLLALVTLTMSVAPALAQDDASVTTDSQYSIRDGLAVIAPLGAAVNTPVTITVLQRSNAGPAEGAGIWALTPENAETLRQRLTAMQANGEMSSADLDWDAIVHVYGRLLGHTDARGKLEATFGESGRYVLLAVKRGYVPGRTGIVIGGGLRALELRAPNRVPVNEPVSMMVLEKTTGTPVSGAGVWALTREQAEAFKVEVDVMRERAQLAQEEIDWESLVSVRGIFLGRTGENRELVTAFAESGGYLLVAVKRGYLPARHGIYVGNPVQLMSMRVQSMAEVGEVVPIHVFNRANTEPVADAGVWAITRERVEAFRQQVNAMQEIARQSQEEIDWESFVSIHGSFLGRTNERGMLETAFGAPGGYLLVSVKRGYVPGHAFIVVRQPRPEVMDGDNARFQSDGTLVEPEPSSVVNESGEID